MGTPPQLRQVAPVLQRDEGRRTTDAHGGRLSEPRRFDGIARTEIGSEGDVRHSITTPAGVGSGT